MAARAAAGAGASFSGRCAGASSAPAAAAALSFSTRSLPAASPFLRLAATRSLPGTSTPLLTPQRALWTAMASSALLRPPLSLITPPFARAASVKQKQVRSGGRKMKTVSCWKRRFKRAGGSATLAPGGTIPVISRHHAGHAHRRTRKPPVVRRRLRSATTVDSAWARRMARRGFVRTAY